jgi:hypothetical protein
VVALEECELVTLERCAPHPRPRRATPLSRAPGTPLGAERSSVPSVAASCRRVVCVVGAAVLAGKADTEPCYLLMRYHTAASPRCAVIDYHVIDSRVIDSRVIDSRVIDSRVIDYRVIDSRVIDSRVRARAARRTSRRGSRGSARSRRCWTCRRRRGRSST